MSGFVALDRRAGPALTGLVESYWYARGMIGHECELIAPTGSVVAAFVFGSPIEQTTRAGRGETFVARTGFVIGPHDQPIVNRPLAETHALGMVLCPAACGRVLGIAPTSLRGRVTDLGRPCRDSPGIVPAWLRSQRRHRKRRSTRWIGSSPSDSVHQTLPTTG
jgi:hypothetical protein